MIDLRRRSGGLDRGRLAGEFDDGSATGGAPVGFGLGGNDGVAMAAGAFHLSTILYSGLGGAQRAWVGRGAGAGRTRGVAGLAISPLSGTKTPQ